MKKVLIVSYRYPPMQSIGSIRTAKIAKYLPRFGWIPIILTVKPERPSGNLPNELTLGSVIRTKDFDMANEIKKILRKDINTSLLNLTEHQLASKNRENVNLKIKRYLSNFYSHCICFPDAHVGWYFIQRNYIQILRSKKIDIVFSSSEPPTSHLIANFLKDKLKVPWVADFRDLWTQNYIFKRIKFFWFLERMLEKKVIKNADILTTVSEPLSEQLKFLHNKDIFVIKNGFDEDDFRKIARRNISPIFNVVYTGKIYAGKRDPYKLFLAYKQLLDAGYLNHGEMKFEFYGPEFDTVRKTAFNLGIQKDVEFHSTIPYLLALEKQATAQVLLSLEWDDVKAKGVFTGKIFEYLGAKRPILAIGPRGGVIDSLLNETKAGFLSNSVNEIKGILLPWIKQFRTLGYIRYNGNPKLLAAYTREKQTEKLSQIFNCLSQGLRFTNEALPQQTI